MQQPLKPGILIAVYYLHCRWVSLTVSNRRTDPCFISSMKRSYPQCTALLKSLINWLWVAAVAWIQALPSSVEKKKNLISICATSNLLQCDDMSPFFKVSCFDTNIWKKTSYSAYFMWFQTNKNMTQPATHFEFDGDNNDGLETGCGDIIWQACHLLSLIKHKFTLCQHRALWDRTVIIVITYSVYPKLKGDMNFLNIYRMALIMTATETLLRHCTLLRTFLRKDDCLIAAVCCQCASALWLTETVQTVPPRPPQSQLVLPSAGQLLEVFTSY